MTLLFGTLGFTPEKLLPSFRNHTVEGLVFFHDRAEESLAAARRVKEYCEREGVPCTAVPVAAFDMVKTAKRIQDEVRKHRREEVIFNISGGTPVLATAATLVCIIEGLRTICLHSRNGTEIDLPLPRIERKTFLSKPQQKVLAAIHRAGDKGITQVQLQNAVSIKRATISHHVKSLRAKGLVSETPEGREKRVRASETAALLLDEGSA